MHVIIHRLLLAVALLLPYNQAAAEPAAKPQAAASARASTPAPLKLQAPSYILLDFATGKVLVEKNADARRDPASLTKMMTAYVAYAEIKSGRLKLDDMVKISKKAWKAKGTRTFLDVNSQVPVDVLLKGLMIQSGNDAAIALAEHIGGTEQAFVALMNYHAQLLGMTNTHYMNAHGLSHSKHYSSARDLATLGLVQMRDFPQYNALYSTKEFTWNNIRQHNRNKLLWRDPSVDGIKTGYTVKARYCQAASAERDGVRLVSVLLGANTPNIRTREVQALLDYGFSVSGVLKR